MYFCNRLSFPPSILLGSKQGLDLFLFILSNLIDWQETNYTPVVYAINLPDSGWQEVGILVKDVIKNECKVNRSICIKKENVNMHIMLDRGC